MRDNYWTEEETEQFLKGIRPCPFCEFVPDAFGHDVFKGKVVPTVIHPMIEDDHCILSLLVFRLPQWQIRMVESREKYWQAKAGRFASLANMAATIIGTRNITDNNTDTANDILDEVIPYLVFDDGEFLTWDKVMNEVMEERREVFEALSKL